MDELKQLLKISLANSFAFYLKAQFYHWNVVGENFPQYHSFLGDLYEEVYGSGDNIAELMIPQVMLHDEITTDGYGKCIIELMTLHGILIKCTSNANNSHWQLGPKWEEKKIFLCLDGLSLDRHRGFCKKLIKLPMSFTNAYMQSQIFQKALTRVVELNGPLHTAFHILQSIYIVYNCFLKCIKQCIGWKKLNFLKVSDNYKLCVHMIDIAYEEVFRLLFFTFLLHYSRMNNVASTSTENKLLVIDLLQKFNEYIELKARTCTDERWLLLIYFYKLVSLFKSYKRAMRAGDSVSMEAVENVFCGVFVLLDKSFKKKHYLQMCICLKFNPTQRTQRFL